MGDQVHVAVAVIRNQQNQVLITLRPDHVHQGGLWEFPGGKVEAGESVYDALVREIHEENGVDIKRAQPLIKIPFRYPDKHVLLDVWEVLEFRGTVHGKEGQQCRWIDVAHLDQYSFPAANEPIVKAVQLPAVYVITPDPGKDVDKFIARISVQLSSGIDLLQLRAKQLSSEAYLSLADTMIELCHRNKTKVLLNAGPELLHRLPADGIHLTSEKLMQLDERPVSKDLMVAASCHSLDEIEQANRMGVDLIVLAPVKKTASHPDAQPLGWTKFSEWTTHATMPVYALGGMTNEDVITSRQNGGQGIAGISAYWDPM